MCQKWYKPLETYKKPLKVSISVIFRHFWAYLPQSRKLFHNKLWRVVKFIESCKKMVTNVNETPIESEFGVGTHKILFNYLFKVKCLSISYTHTHKHTWKETPKSKLILWWLTPLVYRRRLQHRHHHHKNLIFSKNGLFSMWRHPIFEHFTWLHDHKNQK